MMRGGVRRAIWWALFSCFLAFGVFISPSATAEGDPALGQRLYLKGILASGEPLRGMVQGDVAVSGVQDIACAKCHRRSGYGASEGGRYVLPITGPELFQPREANRAKIFNKLFKEDQTKLFRARMRSPHMRPAYSEETLARAIREGTDAAGRKLDKTMPRYALSSADMDNLVAYLKAFRVAPDPGVDGEYIHFATIVTERSDRAKWAAMLNTMNRFVTWINLETTGNRHNPNFSPNYRSELLKSARLWTLTVWELKGSSDTWPAQLANFYSKQPVFAVLGGLVDGPWAPIAQFCEHEELPCLFPQTQLPSVSGDGIYSVFFNRGLMLEADVAAQFVTGNMPGGRVRILQMFQGGGDGSVPARVFAKQLSRNASVDLESLDFKDAREVVQKTSGKSYDVLVLWPGDLAPEVLRNLSGQSGLPPRIVLPSAALEQIPPGLSADFKRRLLFVYPYDLPDAHHPDAYRSRGWLRSQKVELSYPQLQLDTYYTLNIVQYGLDEIIERFSRDYLLEAVERLAESAMNPGVYPRLSLGPNQRFASRGAYVVRLPPDDTNLAVIPASQWTVP